MRGPRPPPNPDEEFAIILPAETRLENRLPIEHAQAHWRMKLREYDYRCAYCGIKSLDTTQGYLTRDHVRPVTKGGTDDIDNIVPACWPCNKTKGNHYPGERVWTLDYTRRVAVPHPKHRRRVRRWYL